jgi:ribonuclease P protein component
MPKFRKDEKLCSKKLIDKLFTVGYSFAINPFKINILTENFHSYKPAKILIIVSKKRFKNAVTRNLIKRKIREAYRFNKRVLYEILNENKLEIIFSLLYFGKEQISYKEIESEINVILNKMEHVIKQNFIQE